MQSDAHRWNRKRFATRKQEVQSLYLSNFNDSQIRTLTGVHRRNVSKYVTDKSIPRALPRQLTKDEFKIAVTIVGEPAGATGTLASTAGYGNIIQTAYVALDKQKSRLEPIGAAIPPLGTEVFTNEGDEDVEHYYDRVLEKLKRGKEDGSN